MNVQTSSATAEIARDVETAIQGRFRIVRYLCGRSNTANICGRSARLSVVVPIDAANMTSY